MFSCRSFIILTLIVVVFNLFWDNFYVILDVGIQFYSFAYRYSIFPIPLLEELSLPHWIMLAVLSKITWPYILCMGLFLGSLFHCVHVCQVLNDFLKLMFEKYVFIPVLHCFDSFGFVISFEIKSCKTCGSSRLAIWGPLKFYMILERTFLFLCIFSKKCHWNSEHLLLQTTFYFNL